MKSSAIPVKPSSLSLPCIDSDQLRNALQDCRSPLPIIKPELKRIQQESHQYFRETLDAASLVRNRATLIDQILALLWQQQGLGDLGVSLLAVGGYGRGELHPHSDIDLLIVLKDEDSFESNKEVLQSFVTLLWDLKLDIGHSVRTMDECIEEARKDLTIITNMMESRTLAGDQTLIYELQAATHSKNIWSTQEFFSAKWQELWDRHKKHNDTEYNLEPNVKNSPGTLRDLQTINWVCLRYFEQDHLLELKQQNFLTEFEYDFFLGTVEFLWQIRYALHMLSDKEEDRMLFDLQKDLAEIFGFQDNNDMIAVEQLMKQFYRNQQSIIEITDQLLIYFEDSILNRLCEDSINQIDEDFYSCNQYLRIKDNKIFGKKPELLIKVFVVFAQHPEIKGFHADVIRALRDYRVLIDDKYRKDIRNNKLFMALLKSPERVSTSLKRMMRYGILGKYIPEFGHIRGYMQYDLFHLYTTDEHSFRMVQMLRRLRYGDEREQFPIASKLIHRIDNCEYLYLTALLHDAGKLEKGEHELCGAEIAEKFCKQHNISKFHTRLISWLIKNHLFMSNVSQRIDVNDPDEIHQFALEIGDQLHLDCLYLITITDVVTTNPKLWTSWRAEQFRQLYKETQKALRLGLENQVAKEDRITAIQQEALFELERLSISEQQALSVWDNPGEDYFIREGVDNIIWHTQILLKHGNSEAPLIELRDTSTYEFEGATQIFIFMKDEPNLFAVTTATLDQLNLNIQDARIMTSNNKNAVDTYIVLDENNQPIGNDRERIAKIRATLTQALSDPEHFETLIQRRTSRILKQFKIATQVTMSNDSINKRTVLDITSADRPGLLACMGALFAEHNVLMQGAKIFTEGERVSDIFYITDQQGQPISDPDFCQKIQLSICHTLDEQVEAQSNV